MKHATVSKLQSFRDQVTDGDYKKVLRLDS